MPTIKPPERHRAIWKQFFGQSEKDNFVEGIKNRREGTDKAESSDFFFDPATTEISAPMGMMTRYMKSGIPDVAKRIQGTEAFKRAARAMGPSVENAASFFAERYPRIAAHMSLSPLDAAEYPKFKQLEGLTKVGQRDLADNIPIRTPVKLKAGSPNAEEAMLHEGTHVAQELGSGSERFPRMYQAAEDAAKVKFGERKGYQMNPWEISARTSASRKMGEKLRPMSATKAYDRLMDDEDLIGTPASQALLRAKSRRR